MTYFVRQGDDFMVTTESAFDLHKSLPAGTYTVKYNERTDTYYLKGVRNFVNPKKLYGDTAEKAARILNTFTERESSTGVMLSGEQGSGKTLLAKVISETAIKLGIPTLVISEAHYGNSFNSFIQSIDQPLVVLFDEFEKVYDAQEQEQLLTLLDGVYPTRKLFIITCNDRYRVNQHMRNRPGRLFYRLDFVGVDSNFIREYCNDQLRNKDNIDGVVNVGAMFAQFSFDMLKALVEEMNRYDESAGEAILMINAKPESQDATRYGATLSYNGKTYETEFAGNPLATRFRIYLNDDDDDDDDGTEDPYGAFKLNLGGGKRPSLDRILEFEPVHLQGVDRESGTLSFKNSHGVLLKLVRRKVEGFDWASAF